MKKLLITAGCLSASLSSCTNLFSFSGSYENLCRAGGGASEYETCCRGYECYNSFSPLVLLPKYPARWLGASWYDNYLARYTASTLTLHEGTYRSLKNQHFTTPTAKRHLVNELQALHASAAVSPEAKSRLRAELQQLGAEVLTQEAEIAQANVRSKAQELAEAEAEARARAEAAARHTNNAALPPAQPKPRAKAQPTPRVKASSPQVRKTAVSNSQAGKPKSAPAVKKTPQPSQSKQKTIWDLLQEEQ